MTEREVIVCGDRFGNPTPEDEKWLTDMFRELKATAAVHGDCEGGEPFFEPGYDRWAGAIALACGLLEVKCPADWSLGQQAGPIRNSSMANRPHVVACLVFPGNTGTQDMATKARRRGIPLFYRVPPRSQAKPASGTKPDGQQVLVGLCDNTIDEMRIVNAADESVPSSFPLCDMEGCSEVATGNFGNGRWCPKCDPRNEE